MESKTAVAEEEGFLQHTKRIPFPVLTRVIQISKLSFSFEEKMPKVSDLLKFLRLVEKWKCSPGLKNGPKKTSFGNSRIPNKNVLAEFE